MYGHTLLDCGSLGYLGYDVMSDNKRALNIMPNRYAEADLRRWKDDFRIVEESTLTLLSPSAQRHLREPSISIFCRFQKVNDPPRSFRHHMRPEYNSVHPP
jgi:hypothetical protein